ncbi:MAG: Glycosyltransferase 2-like domain-containing protein [uncultured Clostridium sp.]
MVSVIVPVYNGEKYLRECIDSICNQSYKDLQIIIINDGSKDNTSRIAKQIVCKDNRIIYTEHENRGASYSRNKGLDLATGEYIVFVDCDDTVEKEYIELLLKQITKNNLDIVSCGYTDISIYGTIKLNDFYIGSSILNKDDFINNIFNGVGGTLWGKIFKTEIINKNKVRLNNNIFMCEDMIFVLNYAMQSKKFGAIEENLYNYNRKNENSVSSKINFKYFNNLVEVMKEIEKILSQNKYDSKFIDSILSDRIKNLVLSFSIMQHDKRHKYSRDKKIDNIKFILENNYLKKYKNVLYATNKSEQRLIKFIKEDNIKNIYYYSYYIFFMMKLKKSIKNFLKYEVKK